jgi:hypothetical protein
MPNRILTSSGYQEAIRELLGVTAQTLPDTAIDRENIITLAEAAIIRQVPTYADIITADGDDAVYLRAAATAQVAANCCPGLAAKFKTSEQSETGFKYTKNAIDWSAKRAEMEAIAQGYIGIISTVSAAGQTYTLAGLNGPTRVAALADS